MRHLLVSILIMVCCSALVALEIPEAIQPLPAGWTKSESLPRIAKSRYDRNNSYTIESFVIKPFEQEELNYFSFYEQREMFDNYLKNQCATITGVKKSLSKKNVDGRNIIDVAIDNKTPIFIVFRAIIALDQTNSATENVYNQTALEDFHHRIVQQYQTFPSSEYLKETRGGFMRKVKNSIWWGNWRNQPPEWFGGFAPYPTVLHQFIMDTHDNIKKTNYWGMSVDLQELVTQWQNDHQAPYTGGPNPVTNVWIWKDYWSQDEVAEYTSHLQWLCEHENAAVNLPIKHVENLSGVAPATGIDWAARYAAGKPHVLNTRPPVSNDTWLPTLWQDPLKDLKDQTPELLKSK